MYVNKMRIVGGCVSDGLALDERWKREGGRHRETEMETDRERITLIVKTYG